MSRLLALSCILGPAALAAQPVAPAPAPATSPVAITEVTIVDVGSGRILPRQTVVVRGARIDAMGPSRTTKAPADARLVDGADKFLIPGLWDMHAHWPGDAVARTIFIPDEIANGVTGIRDMWGTESALRQRDDVKAGRLFGPRMIVATPIIDGRMFPGSLAAATPADGRRLVDSLKARGYDFVKTYEFLPRDVFLAIADEAKRVGLPLAGHVPLSVSAGEASDAGLRSFEHDIGVTLACSRDEVSIRATLLADEAKLPPASAALHSQVMERAETEPLPTFDAAKCSTLAARLRKNGTWLVPTLALYRGRGAMLGSPVREDPRLKYVPAGMRKAFADDTPMAGFESIRPHMGRLATTMQHAGVGILLGTDTSNPYVIPGFSVHDELALLVDGGFTPLEALQAATLNPARFLGAADSLGSVERGKVADLVLLDANPLADIHNTTRIRAVFANGRYLDRAALDTLLVGVERAANPSQPGKSTP